MIYGINILKELLFSRAISVDCFNNQHQLLFKAGYS